MPELPTTVRRYSVTQTDDGFRVASLPEADRPDRILVRAAYNVRRGNPFKKYDTADFRFNSGSRSLNIRHRGCDLDVREDNRIELCPTEDEFELVVEGFDPNRDLIIRHNARDDDDAEIAGTDSE
jgi:hypothetical protein